MTKKSPSAIDKHVGNRIRARRIVIGMSQEMMAGKLGLTFQQIQKYEKGTNRISASRLFEIAEILRVDVPHLYHGLSAGTPSGDPSTDIATELLANRGTIELVQSFLAIDDDELRRAVISLVKAAAARFKASNESVVVAPTTSRKASGQN